MKQLASFVILALSATAASATEISVNITGIKDSGGAVGCGLHADPAAFPSSGAPIQSVWVTPSGGFATCRFTNVTPGKYAIAASHDLNGNRKVDTNAIGLPTEAWGVSRNVRPMLRAPRFQEAAFDLGGTPVAIDIELR